MRLATFVTMTLAVTFSASVAHAQSTKAVLEKYNMLGTFAINCAKPAAKDNYYIVRRAIDDDRIQSDVMIGSTEVHQTTVIDRASGLGPNEVTVGLTSEKNERFNNLMRVEQGRTRTISSAKDSGEKNIAEGRTVAENGLIPWMNRCDGVSTKALFEKRNLLGTFAIDCSKPASRANYYMVYRALDAWRVQNDIMLSAKEALRTTVIDRAAETGSDEVALSVTPEQTDYVLKVDGNRFRVMAKMGQYGRNSLNGDVFIANGKDIKDGKEGAAYPWMIKCKS